MSFTANITRFIADECMRDYSASVAEIGADAGQATWQASIDNAPDWNFIPDDQLDHFRDWVASSGGWTREEIEAWSVEQLQALCLQWIAADVRETGADEPGADWDEIMADQEAGLITSSIYRGDDGEIYWECMD